MYVFDMFRIVKNGFSNLTKVQIGWDQYKKMSQMTIRRRLSERAVVKENKLGWMCLQQRRLTPKKT